jgi:hypothetical protein
MTTAGKLDRGRESFRQPAWAGAYALLSSADQVPRSVGEGFGQVSAQFRELELEGLGQTPPRLVEHVVARLSDFGAVTGEFMSKAVRALGAQASVPSEVSEPEDVGPDDPASAAVRAFIAQHTRAPRRADVTYRRDPDGVSDSVHRMRARRCRRCSTRLGDGRRSGPKSSSRTSRACLGVRRTPNGSRCESPSGPGMPARRSRPCSARRPRLSPARWRRSRRSWANTRTLLTLAQRSASFTLGVLHAADASRLRRPAAGSRCGPKSAAAGGADG